MHFFTFLLVSFLLSEVARDVKCIVHGENAAEGEFKYTAFIQRMKGGCLARCTGSILNSKHILTAAHCTISTLPSELKVGVGITNLRTSSVGRQILQVEKIKMHPDFPLLKVKPSYLNWMKRQVNDFLGDKNDDDYPMPNDIAVLTLEKEIQMGDRVQSITLPPAGAPVPYNHTCISSGWGAVSLDDKVPLLKILQKAEMTIYDPANCTTWEEKDHDWMFCAAGKKDETLVHIWKGDSGGPFVCNGVLVGVAHAGLPQSPHHGMFQITSYYIEFIKKSAEMLKETEDSQPKVA